jgi:hypothetical protein
MGGVYLINNYGNIDYKTNIDLNMNINMRYVTYIISKEEWDFIYKTEDRDILYLYLMKIINRNEKNSKPQS